MVSNDVALAQVKCSIINSVTVFSVGYFVMTSQGRVVEDTSTGSMHLENIDKKSKKHHFEDKLVYDDNF